MRHWYVFLILTVFGCAPGSGTTSVREFNDFFASGGKVDRNFTQGLEISHASISDEDVVSRASAYLPSFSPNFPPVDSSTLTVGQKLYTPEDLTAPELQVGDNPYAGWLYTSLARHSQVEDVYMETSLSLGVVGPSAQGEAVQKWFHKLCDCDEPMGWDNQLHDEPALMLTHTRRWMDDETILFNSHEWGSMSEIETRGGNVHTDLTYTKTFMVGEFRAPAQRFSYYLFTKIGSSLIGRNIFYDGNTFRDSHSVSKEQIVGFITPGVHLTYRGLGIEFAWVARTKDYEEQTGDFNNYGTITFGFVPQNFMESDQ